jgi:hypothetical protein
MTLVLRIALDLVPEDADAVAPGASATARGWPLLPGELPRSLAAGAVFTLLEGDRIVARARLLERLEDGEPQPLRDLRAAKRRPLRAAP